MLSFANDYINGAHPAVLQHLLETNCEVLPGYGSDPVSARAAEKIRSACACPDADVFFLTGGTQTNQLIISSLLKNWEGVIAAHTGHVSLHEAGAIEYTGHKVIPIPGTDGKLTAADIDRFIETFYADEAHEHMVFPGMVYLSFPTEYGTLYSKAELQAISSVCRTKGLPLFIDGARLGYGLMSPVNDLTLPELASFSDVFYIGGTKVGALCGEAVVFPHNDTPPHFINQMKQHGALLAKGRLLGAQFEALFTDDLYFRISTHAIDMAMKMKRIFTEKDYDFFLDSPTNQQFVILPNEKMEQLREKVDFCFWEKFDENRTVVRFATSWSTSEADLLALKQLL